MQPESLEEARDWLRRAQRDLLGAGRALSGEPILADLAAFHAQQAKEKALKAFLAAHDQPFPKTHNLERLVGFCQRIDSLSQVSWIRPIHSIPTSRRSVILGDR
jgi:HEPN domain-containing protein